MTPTKYTWRQFWTNRYVPAKSRCTPAQRVALWVLPALYIGAAVLFAWMILAGVKLAHDAWFKATHATSSATHGHWRSGIAGMPVEDVATMVRDIRKEMPIDLVIVDYLQCIRAKTRTQDRRNEVTHVTKQLVDVIREVGAAGLLLSQLKRTERIRPEIEDLKESGDIEDMADHVLLGFKELQPEGTPDKRFVIVAKNKDGVDDIGDIEMAFDTRTASFESTKRIGQYDHFDDIMDDTISRYP